MAQAWLRARLAHDRFTTPTAEGLPNLKVLAWFPLLTAALLAAAVGLSLNGTSAGLWWQQVGNAGADPDLLAGSPRPIRVDEWSVQSSWLVSQVSENFPSSNHVLPGGMDASLMSDMPSRDWSTFFRPHLWGFVLGLDQGVAARWWVPAALMLIATYVFVITLLPRRPGFAALLCVGLVFQPLLQWTWLPSVFAPVAFAFAAMTAAVWGLRARTVVRRWVPSLLAAYLAVDMAMSLYLPLMLTATLAAGGVIIGIAVDDWRHRSANLWRTLVGLLPLVVAGSLAAAITVAWVLTRRAAVTALLGTVYPGNRSTPPGTGSLGDLAMLFGAPFQRALQHDVVLGLGPEQTDAASILLIGVFLMVPLALLGVLRWRRERRIDPIIVSLLVVQVVGLAWIFVPDWGPVAKLLLLDKTLVQRFRLFFMILGVVSIVVLQLRLQEQKTRLAWTTALASGALVVVSAVGVWSRLAHLHSPAVPSCSPVMVTALLAGSIVFAVRRAPLSAALAVLIGSLILGAGVNPVYRGTFDLRTQTALGVYVEQMSSLHPRAGWLGIGNVSSHVLVQSGVRAYNGTQTYPPARMWNQIDPSHDDGTAWNRYASITWIPGHGAPDPRLARPHVPDQVTLTFDPCASFPQRHVGFVAVDAIPIDQTCLTRLAELHQGSMTYYVYRVVADAAG